ncbi:MAG: glycosyltransferase family 4 protein [Bryobacteraceae bacterium]|jgi:glycosyltransferase involved in cell wall biosynthesis
MFAKEMKPRVIVTHPARMGIIYQRPWAAEKAGMDVRFLTGLYYRPGRFPYSLVRWLPRRRRQAVEKLLEKRRIEGLSPENVTSLLGPSLEAILRPMGWIYQWDQAHDYLASRWISRQPSSGRTTILHAFTGACLRTLRAARARRMVRLLEITLPPLVIDEAQLEKWQVSPRDFPDATRIRAEAEESDFVLVQSPFSVEMMQRLGVRPERIFRIHTGVDTSYFRPRQGARCPGPMRAIFVGPISRRKGVHHLLQAWNDLGLENAELLLAGNTTKPEAGEILRLCGKTARSVGHLSGPDFLATLQNADFLVHPSLAEGGCVSIYEALACGIPCIVSSHADSAVRHGEEGLVVPAGDVEGLKKAILLLSAHTELRRDMSLAARRRAESVSLDVFAAEMAAIYRSIGEVARNGGAPDGSAIAPEAAEIVH